MRIYLSLALALALACSAPAQPKSSEGTTTTTVEVETVDDGVDERQVMLEVLQAKSLDAFTRACNEGLDNAKKLLPVILTQGGEQGRRTADNTLEPYNEMSIQIERSAAMASLMRSVHPDEKIRDASKACEKNVEKFISELGLNRQLYRAFKDLDVSKADAATRRLVKHTLRDFRRAGVDKDAATRKRLKAIDEKLVSLGQKFGENIVKDVRSIKVGSARQLAGLPADYIKGHKPGDDGKITITTDYPDYIPFMAYADNDKLRKELYVAARSRGGMDNELILRQILELRYEKAQILGYANWADYVTEDKMMKSGDNAQQFIERIVKIAKPRADKDIEELVARLRKIRRFRRAKRVEDWQKTYLQNKVKAESYAFDPQSVRPYFEYTRVEKGLLAITAEIYQLEYKKVSDAPVWHQDVRAYDVLRSGEKLGRIYLDMHPREGKYKHAAQFTLRSGVKGLQLPEGVLVCNFPNPRTTDGPALMEHGDVVTMFHEFGHLMHHILAGKQRWIDHSGVATEWDFVEAPSQMFEEWAWEHQTLARFAKHHQTGEAIPAELVERMRKADKFGLGIQTLQQMFYASISLRFHQVPPQKLEMMKVMKDLQSKYTPFPYVEGTRFYANFGHLNGYSAIYYTYMWSLVIAKDLLTPFKTHGLMNPVWTHRYRDRILAPGGTKDAADLVSDFLGRKYDFKAFEEYLGG
jgi:thimet oligopeptidase